MQQHSSHTPSVAPYAASVPQIAQHGRRLIAPDLCQYCESCRITSYGGASHRVSVPHIAPRAQSGISHLLAWSDGPEYPTTELRHFLWEGGVRRGCSARRPPDGRTRVPAQPVSAPRVAHRRRRMPGGKRYLQSERRSGVRFGRLDALEGRQRGGRLRSGGRGLEC